MNQLDLNERHAVVTGGASGIGFAIAERLAASGATITIWDMDEDAGQKAAAALASQALVVDVTDFASVEQAVEDTLKIVPTIERATSGSNTIGHSWVSTFLLPIVATVRRAASMPTASATSSWFKNRDAVHQ